jgi:ribonuclease D
MELSDLPPPTLVTDESGLGRLLEDLDGHSEVAFDTEADSFYSYREKVCLIQVTVEDRDYLVDPLECANIAPLGKVLADPNITKVFHDGEYDVLILKRDFQFEFGGIFDTRVAAAALGMQAPGLGSVLADRFDVHLDKSMQRSNWAERPLSDKQVAYARLDTRFLVQLMHDLKKDLEARGRSMIVEGECRRLEALEPVPFDFKPDEFVRVKGVRTLDLLGAQCLRELYALRESIAAENNSPPFRVMNNQALLDIARIQPKDMRHLTSISGFTPRQGRRFGDRVLAALSKGHELGALDRLPKLAKKDGTSGLDELQIDLYERLKKFRKGIAEDHEIESAYLLNRHVMLRIALQRPASREALASVEGLLSWQLEMFGEPILETIAEFERAVADGEIPAKKTRRRR